MFAGVDALIPGTLTPINMNIDLTAKIITTFLFVNLNASEAVNIALTYDVSPTTLINKRGDQYTTGQSFGWVSGLGQAPRITGEYQAQFTEVAPGNSVKATINYYPVGGTLANYPYYRLVLPLLVGKEVDGGDVNVKTFTFMIDVNEAK